MADEDHVDGNGVAGLLEEVLLVEVTTAQRVCQSCGTRSALGAHRAYTAAATVVRCPACGDVAARVARRPDGHVVELRGVWTLRA
jgi:Zn finger protein HypA/HybF involved in hydrogenase expression